MALLEKSIRRRVSELDPSEAEPFEVAREVTDPIFEGDRCFGSPLMLSWEAFRAVSARLSVSEDSSDWDSRNLVTTSSNLSFFLIFFRFWILARSWAKFSSSELEVDWSAGSVGVALEADFFRAFWLADFVTLDFSAAVSSTMACTCAISVDTDFFAGLPMIGLVSAVGPGWVKLVRAFFLLAHFFLKIKKLWYCCLLTF